MSRGLGDVYKRQTQGPVSQKFILRLQRQTPEKLPGGLSMKATQKPSAGEQIIRWNVLQKTVGKSLKIPTQI